MALASQAQASQAGQNVLTTKSNWLSKLYLPALIPGLLLIIYGVVVVWSASLSIPEANFPRHIFGVVIGLGAFTAMWKYDYRSLSNLTTALLVVDCVLMLLPKVPGLGVSAKGMTGWVAIPFIGFNFQPSELAKLVTIFLIAAVCAQYNGKIDNLKDYFKVCGYLLVPFILINILPDLGTGLIILVLGASVIICAGAKHKWYLMTIALIVAVASLAIITSMTPGLPHILKEYQLNRLIVFMDSSVDPSGNGYNLMQSKIAVGSGGLIGKGIGNATQSGSGFLPEAQTDFVFALLSEEFGFVGASILIGLYAWLVFATLSLAVKTDNLFGRLVLVGCSAMWGFQVLQNAGMCIGIMPITGIPLPFVSYGTTSLVVQIISLGMVQSVWRNRTKSA